VNGLNGSDPDGRQQHPPGGYHLQRPAPARRRAMQALAAAASTPAIAFGAIHPSAASAPVPRAAPAMARAANAHWPVQVQGPLLAV